MSEGPPAPEDIFRHDGYILLLCVTVCIERCRTIYFLLAGVQLMVHSNIALLACNQPRITGTVLAASRALLCPIRIPYIVST
jgi:hypothetical protein